MQKMFETVCEILGVLGFISIIVLLMLGAAGVFGEPERSPTSKQGNIVVVKPSKLNTGDRNTTSGYGFWERRREARR